MSCRSSNKARWRWLYIASALWFLWPSSPAWSWPNQYDGDIKRAVDRYWPAFPFWKAWKAQLIAESGLRPNAVSPVGAAGLAQFMPGTWADTVRAMGLPTGATPFEAKYAIEAGAFYMAKRRADWRARRPEIDRHRLAQASYNAGHGNILAAQRACGMPTLYEPIIACLAQITGRHSEETIGYVARIDRLWKQLEVMP